MSDVQGAGFERGIIPVWCHIPCWILISFGGAYAGFAGGELLGRCLGLTEGTSTLLGGAGLFAAFIFPSNWFRSRVPARCGRCAGRTWCRFDHPFFIYKCASCGHTVKTGIGPGET